jgi:NAD(P)-dependent dehydrogenase (short-subunit alcohol dehydrogenase family)
MPQTTVKGDKVIILGDSGGVAKEVAEALEREKLRVFVTHDLPREDNVPQLDALWGCELIRNSANGAKRKTLSTFGSVDHIVFFDDGHVLPQGSVADSVVQLVTRLIHELTPKHSVLLVMNEAVAEPEQPSVPDSGWSQLVLQAAHAHAPLRVNAITTNLISHAIYCKLPAVAKRQALDSIAEQLPLGKKFATHYLADAILFLLGNDFITNAMLPVDGGQGMNKQRLVQA